MIKQKLTEMVDPVRPMADPDQISHLPHDDAQGCAAVGCAATCFIVSGAVALWHLGWAFAIWRYLGGS